MGKGKKTANMYWILYLWMEVKSFKILEETYYNVKETWKQEDNKEQKVEVSLK